MKTTLDSEIQKRIDSALAKVKEPQSDVPIVDLGLVNKVTYSAREKTLVVSLAIGTPRFQCPACSAINGVVKQGIERRIVEKFSEEFPDHRIILE